MRRNDTLLVIEIQDTTKSTQSSPPGLRVPIPPLTPCAWSLHVLPVFHGFPPPGTPISSQSPKMCAVD